MIGVGHWVKFVSEVFDEGGVQCVNWQLGHPFGVVVVFLARLDIVVGKNLLLLGFWAIWLGGEKLFY